MLIPLRYTNQHQAWLLLRNSSNASTPLTERRPSMRPRIHRHKTPSTRFFHRTSESGLASSWLRSTIPTPLQFLSVRLSPRLRRSQSSHPNVKPLLHDTGPRWVSPRPSSAPCLPRDALFCMLPSSERVSYPSLTKTPHHRSPKACLVLHPHPSKLRRASLHPKAPHRASCRQTRGARSPILASRWTGRILGTLRHRPFKERPHLTLLGQQQMPRAQRTCFPRQILHCRIPFPCHRPKARASTSA